MSSSDSTHAGIIARLLFGATLVTSASGCTVGNARESLSSRAAISARPGEPADMKRPTATVSAADAITTVEVTRKPWRFADYEGQIIITPHYRLYTTLKHHSVLKHLPLLMERGLIQYTTALGQLPRPSGRLETYLFESRNQWEAKTRQMLPEQSERYLALGRGGFTTRGTSVLYYIGRTDTLSITAHEGWHQYSQQTFRQQLPVWLEEGIATYMEGHLSRPDGIPKFRPWANLERYHTLRDAVREDRLIPLGDLLQRTPQSFLERGRNKLLIYYAQVWALTHFLAEGEQGRYRPALHELLLDTAQGRLSGRILSSKFISPSQRRRVAANVRIGPWVLLDYFDSDLASFEQRYTFFVRQIVKTGGRDRIVQGQSPLTN